MILVGQAGLPGCLPNRSDCANLRSLTLTTDLSRSNIPCMVVFYTSTRIHMPAEKTVSVSFRVTPEFKELLEVAADREQRSRTNLLEKLLFDHCRQLGVLPTSPVAKKTTRQGNR